MKPESNKTTLNSLGKKSEEERKLDRIRKRGHADTPPLFPNWPNQPKRKGITHDG